MAVVGGPTSVSATTETNIHECVTVNGEAISSVRIVNDNATDVTINFSMSTTTGAQQASGKMVPDGFVIPSDTAWVSDPFTMTTSNEFLVLYASAAVNAIVSGVEIT